MEGRERPGRRIRDKVGITAGASTPDWIIEEVFFIMDIMETKKFAVIGEYVICCPEDEKLIRCDMSTGKKKELADHIQYFFAGAKLYAQKGSKIVSVSYDGKEIRVFKKDVVMMDKKEDKIYYRRMDRKKEQMYVCDVDGGMEKMVGNEAGKD